MLSGVSGMFSFAPTAIHLFGNIRNLTQPLSLIIYFYSEVLTLRNTETVEVWRYNALVIAIIFFVRFALQIREYVTVSMAPKELGTTSEMSGLMV